MITVCVSDLLLAVMWSEGVTVQGVVAPVPAGIKTHQLLLALSRQVTGSYLIQVYISA